MTYSEFLAAKDSEWLGQLESVGMSPEGLRRTAMERYVRAGRSDRSLTPKFRVLCRNKNHVVGAVYGTPWGDAVWTAPLAPRLADALYNDDEPLEFNRAFLRSVRAGHWGDRVLPLDESAGRQVEVSCRCGVLLVKFDDVIEAIKARQPKLVVSNVRRARP